MKLTKKVIENTYKTMDIEIFDQFYFDNKETLYGFMSYKMVTHFEIDNPYILYIAFHVNTEPEFISYVLLSLVRKFEKNNIRVETMDSFSYDDKGNFLNGSEAYEAVEKENYNTAVTKFVNFQNQINYLRNVEGFRA